MLDQVGQQGENLRFESQNSAFLTQFESGHVQLESVEQENHFDSPAVDRHTFLPIAA